MFRKKLDIHGGINSLENVFTISSVLSELILECTWYLLVDIDADASVRLSIVTIVEEALHFALAVQRATRKTNWENSITDLLPCIFSQKLAGKYT